MLLLNDVFPRTWGDRAGAGRRPGVLDRGDRRGAGGPPAASCSWPRRTGTWSGSSSSSGFDHCYDKRLYDRLLHEGPASVRGHLGADLGYQRGLVRFLENHDEPRAAAELRAASRSGPRRWSIATLPGRHAVARGPVRGVAGAPAGVPRPAPGGARRRRTAGVLPARSSPRPAGSGSGDWSLCEATGWPDDSQLGSSSCRWCWIGRDGRVPSSWSTTPTRRPRPGSTCPWARPRRAGRGGSRTCWRATCSSATATSWPTTGLYVQLPPWGFHVLTWSSIGDAA